MYVYASTDEILYRALIDSPLFPAVKKGEFEMVDIKEGDIVKICSDGKLEYGKFEYSCYYGRAWWDYSFSAHEDRTTLRDEYIKDFLYEICEDSYTCNNGSYCGFLQQEV